MNVDKTQLLRTVFNFLIGIGMYSTYVYFRGRPEIRLDFIVNFFVGFVLGGLLNLSINIYLSKALNQPFELPSGRKFHLAGGLFFSLLTLLGILPSLI